jgi:hypothetical protein
MDHDGKLDLITAHLRDDGVVRVHLGRADGTFAAETTVEVGKAPQALAVGDVYGDGKLHVVVANYASNDVSLLRARGNGHFHAERRINLNAAALGPTAITIAVFELHGIDLRLDTGYARFHVQICSARSSGLRRDAHIKAHCSIHAPIPCPAQCRAIRIRACAR